MNLLTQQENINAEMVHKRDGQPPMMRTKNVIRTDRVR